MFLSSARTPEPRTNRDIRFEVAVPFLLVVSFALLTACGLTKGPSSQSTSTTTGGGSSSSTGGSGTSGSGSGGSGSGGSSGNTAPSFTNLQRASGWGQYAQAAPTFVDCSPSPCDGITFSMTQGVSSPSMSGNASEFSLGSGSAFTDALFNNHLLGALSSQNMPDTDGTIVPSLHTFTYDVYFYGDDLCDSQALEFDMNQFFDGMGFIWATNVASRAGTNGISGIT